MLRVRFSFLALVGLFVVSAGYVPRAFSQLSSFSDVALAADFPAPLSSEILHSSLSDWDLWMSNSCTSSVNDSDGSPSQVESAVPARTDINLFAQLIRVPECVLQSGHTDQQETKFDECVEKLDCRRGYHYGCFNDNGDQFATCKRRHCR